MQATKALTHSQRAIQALIALQITTITFCMSAMIGCRPPQLKMPRLDAYAESSDTQQVFVESTVLHPEFSRDSTGAARYNSRMTTPGPTPCLHELRGATPQACAIADEDGELIARFHRTKEDDRADIPASDMGCTFASREPQE